MTADIFESFGDSLIPHPVKRMREAEARRAAKKAELPPMVKHGLEKEREEKSKQMMRYRKFKAEVREGLQRGDYGPEIIELFKLLRRRTHICDIVAYVLSASWMLKCSFYVRETLLGYISNAMMLFNIRNGYPPFDDPITIGDWEVEPADGILGAPENVVVRWGYYFVRRYLVEDIPDQNIGERTKPKLDQMTTQYHHLTGDRI